jgi:hypothetical protein
VTDLQGSPFDEWNFPDKTRKPYGRKTARQGSKEPGRSVTHRTKERLRALGLESEVDALNIFLNLLEQEGGDVSVKRGDYDHNHTLSSSSFSTVIIAIMVAVVILGGLSVGLAILAHF